jgi:hypothetical protein
VEDNLLSEKAEAQQGQAARQTRPQSAQTEPFQSDLPEEVGLEQKAPLTSGSASSYFGNRNIPVVQRQQMAVRLGPLLGNRRLGRLLQPSAGSLLTVQRHTASTLEYEENSLQAKRLPGNFIQRSLVDELNEAMDGWGTDEARILDAIDRASPDERRAALTDARLVARLRDELSRSEALDALTRLGADLPLRLEVAMDGIGAASREILRMTETAPEPQKQAVLRNARLVNRLRDELSREDALTALTNLGASLVVRMNAAMDGWGADIDRLERMVRDAGEADRRQALRDRALINRLKDEVSRDRLQGLLRDLGVSLVDRLNIAMDGWGVDSQAILTMTQDASPEDKAAVLGDSATIRRLASELTREDALTVFARLGLSLADRINTALDGWGRDANAITGMIQQADEQQRHTVLADSALMARLASELDEQTLERVRLLLRFGSDEAIAAASAEELADESVPESLTSKLSAQLDSGEPNVATMLNDIANATDDERTMVRTNHGLLQRLAEAMDEDQFNQALRVLGGSIVDRLHVLIAQQASADDIIAQIEASGEEGKALIRANRPLIEALLNYVSDGDDRRVMTAIGDSLVNQLNHALNEGATRDEVLDLIQAADQPEREAAHTNAPLMARIDERFNATDYWRVRLHLTHGSAAMYPDGLVALIDSWESDGSYENVRRTLANLSTAVFDNIKDVVGIRDCVRELVTDARQIQFILRMLDQGLISEEEDVHEEWEEHLLETTSAEGAPLEFAERRFVGTTGFDIAYFRDRLQVTVRIKLTAIDDDAEAALDGLKTRWKGGIEGVWDNKYRLRNVNHTLPIRITCNFTTSDPHHSVDVQKGPARSNAGLWDTEDTDLVAAHEFGHLLGNRDEYSLSADNYQATVGTEAATDPNAVKETDIHGTERFTNVSNVMGSTSSGDIDQRHLFTMVNWINDHRRRDAEGNFAEPAFTII